MRHIFTYFDNRINYETFKKRFQFTTSFREKMIPCKRVKLPLWPRFLVKKCYFYLQFFPKFPAIFCNTIFGKMTGNLGHFVKNDLQILKFPSKIYSIKEHFLKNFRYLLFKEGVDQKISMKNH